MELARGSGKAPLARGAAWLAPYSITARRRRVASLPRYLDRDYMWAD